MSRYRIILTVLTAVVVMMSVLACTPRQPEHPEDYEEVLVTFAFGCDTKAGSPHTPEVENLIHDIWVIQFNAQGVRIRQDYYSRDGAAGLYVENFQAGLYQTAGSTVCVVVNTNDPTLAQTAFWPNNLPDFQNTLMDISVSNNLSERDRMPMCGYWEGDVTSQSSVLSVLLCRMMVRINLVLNNLTGARLSDLKVTLENIPTMSYIYPRMNHEILPPQAYLQETFKDDIAAINSSASATLYYYIAPNICQDEQYATKVTITDGSRTWSTLLGDEAPGEARSNYSLYANNYYTFTLNLKRQE